MNQLCNPLIGEIEESQSERTGRAQAALIAGRFQVTRISPQRWSVKNGDKLPYAVSLEDGMWACTCMDFRQRGPQIRCKHIEGVRLSEEADYQPFQTNQKETNMDQTQSQKPDDLTQRIDRIIWELRQPLDMSRVKRRQAPGMGSVPYLEGYDVIERANMLFGFAWSFELLCEPVIIRWQKKVLAWNQQEKRKVPVTDASGNVQSEEVGIVYITGKVTVDLGGALYNHADLGRCVFTGDTPEALDMALAGSVTDCLKRCFRQLGSQFGNDLYDKEIAQNAGLDQGTSQSSGNSSSVPATSKPALASTTSSSPVIRKYGDGSNVNGNISEQEAFDQYKKTSGNVPASKDVLRSWMTSQRKTTSSVAA